MMDPLFSTKSVDKATGMGLNVAKTLVEAHGGTLVYDRESPHTCFVITLVRSQAAAAKAGSMPGP